MFSHDYYEIREISIKDQAGTSCAGTDANKAVCLCVCVFASQSSTRNGVALDFCDVVC